VQEAFAGEVFLIKGGGTPSRAEQIQKHVSGHRGTFFAKTAAAKPWSRHASRCPSSVFTPGFSAALSDIEGEFTLGGLVSFLALVPRFTAHHKPAADERQMIKQHGESTRCSNTFSDDP
jgi:hypothetical protein